MKLHASRAWLIQRYLHDRKTIEEMAKEAKTSQMTIRRMLEKEKLLRK
jgi:DeoR/GlpR family transcriptional regulator of sugar metabolism